MVTQAGETEQINLENTDISASHTAEAEKENFELICLDLPVDEFDDHDVHIEEHLRKLLSLESDKLGDSEYKTRIKNHVIKHKKLILNQNLSDISNQIKGE